MSKNTYWCRVYDRLFKMEHYDDEHSESGFIFPIIIGILLMILGIYGIVDFKQYGYFTLGILGGIYFFIKPFWYTFINNQEYE